MKIQPKQKKQRINREREVASKELTKDKDIELQRKNDEAEMLAAEQAKMRKAEAALKDERKSASHQRRRKYG